MSTLSGIFADSLLRSEKQHNKSKNSALMIALTGGQYGTEDRTAAGWMGMSPQEEKAERDAVVKVQNYFDEEKLDEELQNLELGNQQVQDYIDNKDTNSKLNKTLKDYYDTSGIIPESGWSRNEYTRSAQLKKSFIAIQEKLRTQSINKQEAQMQIDFLAGQDIDPTKKETPEYKRALKSMFSSIFDAVTTDTPGEKPPTPEAFKFYIKDATGTMRKVDPRNYDTNIMRDVLGDLTPKIEEDDNMLEAELKKMFFSTDTLTQSGVVKELIDVDTGMSSKRKAIDFLSKIEAREGLGGGFIYIMEKVLEDGRKITKLGKSNDPKERNKKKTKDGWITIGSYAVDDADMAEKQIHKAWTDSGFRLNVGGADAISQAIAGGEGSTEIYDFAESIKDDNRMVVRDTATGKQVIVDPMTETGQKIITAKMESDIAKQKAWKAYKDDQNALEYGIGAIADGAVSMVSYIPTYVGMGISTLSTEGTFINKVGGSLELTGKGIKEFGTVFRDKREDIAQENAILQSAASGDGLDKFKVGFDQALDLTLESVGGFGLVGAGLKSGMKIAAKKGATGNISQIAHAAIRTKRGSAAAIAGISQHASGSIQEYRDTHNGENPSAGRFASITAASTLAAAIDFGAADFVFTGGRMFLGMGNTKVDFSDTFKTLDPKEKIKVTRSIMKAGYRGAGAMVGAAAVESLQETSTEFIKILGENGFDADKVFNKRTYERLKESFIMGGAAGGIGASPRAAASAVKTGFTDFNQQLADKNKISEVRAYAEDMSEAEIIDKIHAMKIDMEGDRIIYYSIENFGEKYKDISKASSTYGIGDGFAKMQEIIESEKDNGIPTETEASMDAINYLNRWMQGEATAKTFAEHLDNLAAKAIEIREQVGDTISEEEIDIEKVDYFLSMVEESKERDMNIMDFMVRSSYRSGLLASNEAIKQSTDINNQIAVLEQIMEERAEAAHTSIKYDSRQKVKNSAELRAALKRGEEVVSNVGSALTEEIEKDENYQEYDTGSRQLNNDIEQIREGASQATAEVDDQISEVKENLEDIITDPATDVNVAEEAKREAFAQIEMLEKSKESIMAQMEAEISPRQADIDTLEFKKEGVRNEYSISLKFDPVTGKVSTKKGALSLVELQENLKIAKDRTKLLEEFYSIKDFMESINSGGSVMSKIDSKAFMEAIRGMDEPQNLPIILKTLRRLRGQKMVITPMDNGVDPKDQLREVKRRIMKDLSRILTESKKYGIVNNAYDASLIAAQVKNFVKNIELISEENQDAYNEANQKEDESWEQRQAEREERIAAAMKLAGESLPAEEIEPTVQMEEETNIEAEIDRIKNSDAPIEQKKNDLHIVLEAMKSVLPEGMSLEDIGIDQEEILNNLEEC